MIGVIHCQPKNAGRTNQKEDSLDEMSNIAHTLVQLYSNINTYNCKCTVTSYGYLYSHMRDHAGVPLCNEIGIEWVVPPKIFRQILRE